MKSTIKVELGHNNQPIIRMKVNPSDDVRDVLFQQFKEAFGGESNLCSVTFNSAFLSSDGTTCIIEISPIPPNELHPALLDKGPSTICIGSTVIFSDNNVPVEGVIEQIDMAFDGERNRLKYYIAYHMDGKEYHTERFEHLILKPTTSII